MVLHTRLGSCPTTWQKGSAEYAVLYQASVPLWHLILRLTAKFKGLYGKVHVKQFQVNEYAKQFLSLDYIWVKSYMPGLKATGKPFKIKVAVLFFFKVMSIVIVF